MGKICFNYNSETKNKNSSEKNVLEGQQKKV